MTITAKYAGFCGKCGHGFPAGAKIDWFRGGKPSHLSAADCAAAKAAAASAPPAPPAPKIEGAAAIAGFLAAAKARGLKFPKARFMNAAKVEILLSIAGPTSRFPGSTQVKLGGIWIGRIGLDGAVAGPLKSDKATLDALALIAADPAAAAKAYGVMTGSCAFCGLALTDAGSVEVGYGPVCAKHWGLPHTPKGTPDILGSMPAAQAAGAAPMLTA